ncbi:hypothetical protein [Streptomyces sp. NPDC088246]|uniref:hypothetical protein n=1 Tax=Streptomyces sp. NPDC088246 TaxID=3365842 RepID=UPI003804D440
MAEQLAGLSAASSPGACRRFPARASAATNRCTCWPCPYVFGTEELTYDLQQLGRAVVVGEPTGGGAHPREGWTVHPHLEATIPAGCPVNPVSGTNWEGTGVQPDILRPTADAPERAHAPAVARLAG